MRPGILDEIMFMGMRRMRKEKILESLADLASAFVEQLSNKYLAFILIAVVLVVSYYIKPILWTYIFSALVTYFVASLIMRYSIDKGLLKIKRMGRTSLTEGHFFLAFVFAITVSTIFSNWLAAYIESLVLLDTQSKLIIIAVQSVIILGLLFLDMEFEF